MHYHAYSCSDHEFATDDEIDRRELLIDDDIEDLPIFDMCDSAKDFIDCLDPLSAPLCPKDIMIGDWVLYDPNVYLNTDHDNREIEIPFKIKNGGDIDDAVHGCYTSIPLTEDILKKMGFKEDRNWYVYKDGNDIIYIALYKSSTDIEYTNVIYNPEDVTETNYSHNFELPYVVPVHQFQHIIRLCGMSIDFEL
jgi:hypothetical protein